MATVSSGWIRWSARLVAVVEKDLLSELRTRHGVNALLIFALTSLVTVAIALAGAPLDPDVQAALLWILILFAATAGLARVFVHEVERGTSNHLRLNATPDLVFCGKFLVNLALLVAVDVLLVPLFVALLGARGVHWGLCIAALALGSIGLAAATTLLAAIVARSGARTALFAGLAFPLLLPVLVTGAAATRTAFGGLGFAAAGAELRVLAAYAVAMFTAGLLLFEFVWGE